MKYFFSMILFFSALGGTSIAQPVDRAVTLSVGYPVTIGDTFLSRYDGVVQIELGYRHAITRRIAIGPTFSFTRLFLDASESIVRHDVNTNVVGGRIDAFYRVDLVNGLSLNPEIGVGYSRFNFDNREDPPTVYNAIAFSTALSILYPINARMALGGKFGYSAALLSVPEHLRSAFNSQFHATTFGVTAKFSVGSR